MPIGRSVQVGKPKLAAGQRDKPVTIQQRPATDTADSSGFPDEDNWTTLVSAEWMSRTDMRADERFGGNQLSATVETQWHMGYRADMDPELVDVPKLRRLRFQGRAFDILSATLLSRSEGIELITLVSTRADG